MEQQSYTQLVLTTCLKAGKIMMEAGSEIYRVEDTMERIAKNAGLTDIQLYVTATGMIIGSPSEQNSQVIQVTKQSINLEKVTAVNQGSRAFAAGEMSLVDFYYALREVERWTPEFPYSWNILSAGVISSTMMILFNGSWWDFIPTFLIGAGGFLIHSFLGKKLNIHFLNDFLAAFFIGAAALIASRLSLATNMNNVVIGGIMPLVPGLAITNSFRDIMAGHLLSGISRGTEALFTAGAIGGGIILTFNFF